jgi:hypothetical protein
MKELNRRKKGKRRKDRNLTAKSQIEKFRKHLFSP